MYRIRPKSILTEEEEQTIMEPMRNKLQDLEDFVEEEQGDDFVRWLMAQQIEITSKTQGSLLKVYRNSTEYDEEHPENNWQFFAGKYEIDLDDIDGAESEVMQHTESVPGYSHNDYYYAIKHIVKRHKAGALKEVPSNALILLQTQLNEQPSVRLHSSVPKGRMVVVGVRYDVDVEWVRNTLRLNQPNEITSNALKNSNRWETHSRMISMAEIFDTDSLPVFFRGRLNTVPKTFLGIERSAMNDKGFNTRLMTILNQLPEDVSKEDIERILRRSLRSVGDMEVRILDEDGKVEQVVDVTKKSMQSVTGRYYRNYHDVSSSIEDTIEQDGKDSQEHIEDFEDLGYMRHWVRNQAQEYAVGMDGDGLISKAIVALSDGKEDITSDNVRRWVVRTMEGEDLLQKVYRSHLKDQLVPQYRTMGKRELFDLFEDEINKIVATRLPHILAELGHLDENE